MPPATPPRIIEIDGPRVRAREAEILRESLVAMVEEGSHHLVLDLSQVEFADSSFLGLLVTVLKRVRPSGGDVKLCCLAPPVAHVVSLMRLDRLFDCYPTREEALRSFP